MCGRWRKMGTLLYLLALAVVAHAGSLYPRESEFRELKSLDGLWDFYIPHANITDLEIEDLHKTGLPHGTGKVSKMPVPASYNDISVDAEVRDYVGTVWYERAFFVPLSWQNYQRVFIRFASVHYKATVWINGEFAVAHEGGHLPFESDIGSLIDFGKSNRVTVAVDNVLTNVTVPQGVVQTLFGSDPEPKKVQTYTFDFFNYAGIHRPVSLYTVPNTYISDINTTSSITPLQTSYDAVITYVLEIKGGTDYKCRVSLVDGDGVVKVFQQRGCEGVLLVPNATLWWPIFMDPKPGHLYLLEAEILDMTGELFDKYRLPVGIRTVTMENNLLLINRKPIYIRGVGKHEDADIRGKGLDFPIMARDIELMKWMGVNCYRTSHYPYSEESMQLADKEGFMVIDEVPSVNTEFYSDELKFKHERVLSELISRDKNYASAIMWSLANEPRTQHNESEPYFRYLRDAARAMDPSRPITIVIAQPYTKDKAGHLCDVLCFNRYNAWYENDGRLETIAPSVISEARAWFQAYGKPVIMAEYGGDTMPGLHRLPSFIWSEEFQADLLSEHFKAFDLLRAEGFFIGEMIWNFADFMTNQDYTRVGGNKKGVFTRDRQPKEGAFILRQRYLELASELDHAPKQKRRYISVPRHVLDEL